MEKITAEFIGFQEDPKINGWRAYYIIRAPGFERDGSTVFALTLNELGIEIPLTPEYDPTKKDSSLQQKVIWFHKCETCKITWAFVKHSVEHVRKHPTHHVVSISVPVVEPIPYNDKPSQVWVRDKDQGRLVLDVPSTPIKLMETKLEEKTIKLDSKVIKESKWSPWAQNHAKRMGFTLEGDPDESDND